MKPFYFPAIGLDISDESFKYLYLQKNKNVQEIGFFGEFAIKPGLIEIGEIKNIDQVSTLIKGVLGKYRVQVPYLIVSLPEEKGFLRLIRIQRLDPKDVRQALEFQLEEHIPHPASDLYFDYEILPTLRKGSDMDIVVTAYPKGLVDAYVAVVEKAGFTPIIFELESQAVARAVVPRKSQEAYLVGDIGHTRTTFSIVYKSSVHFTSTVKIGGRDIDAILMQSLHLTKEEAQDVKIGRGFDFNSEEIIKSLSPALATLKDEADRQISFWERRYPAAEYHIEKVYLCGGDAHLRGFPEFLSRELGLSVERAHIWDNIFNLKAYIPPMTAHDTLRYATAFGLALRSGNIFAPLSSPS